MAYSSFDSLPYDFHYDEVPSDIDYGPAFCDYWRCRMLSIRSRLCNDVLAMRAGASHA